MVAASPCQGRRDQLVSAPPLAARRLPAALHATTRPPLLQFVAENTAVDPLACQDVVTLGYQDGILVDLSAAGACIVGWDGMAGVGMGRMGASGGGVVVGGWWWVGAGGQFACLVGRVAVGRVIPSPSLLACHMLASSRSATPTNRNPHQPPRPACLAPWAVGGVAVDNAKNKVAYGRDIEPREILAGGSAPVAPPPPFLAVYDKLNQVRGDGVGVGGWAGVGRWLLLVIWWWCGRGGGVLVGLHECVPRPAGASQAEAAVWQPGRAWAGAEGRVGPGLAGPGIWHKGASSLPIFGC